jgi:hypothetical protein
MFLGPNHELLIYGEGRSECGEWEVCELRGYLSGYAASEDGSSVLFGYIPDYTDLLTTIT